MNKKNRFLIIQLHLAICLTIVCLAFIDKFIEILNDNLSQDIFNQIDIEKDTLLNI